MTSMILHLSLNGRGPIADQIRDQLRDLIASGQLTAGQELPSIREVAVELAIAPQAVQQAYAQLEAEGLLTMDDGSGVFIRQPCRAGSIADRQSELHRLCESFLYCAELKGFRPHEVLRALQQLTNGDTSNGESA